MNRVMACQCAVLSTDWRAGHGTWTHEPEGRIHCAVRWRIASAPFRQHALSSTRRLVSTPSGQYAVSVAGVHILGSRLLPFVVFLVREPIAGIVPRQQC
jgi:hypothetical protein